MFIIFYEICFYALLEKAIEGYLKNMYIKLKILIKHFLIVLFGKSLWLIPHIIELGDKIFHF